VRCDLTGSEMGPTVRRTLIRGLLPTARLALATLSPMSRRIDGAIPPVDIGACHENGVITPHQQFQHLDEVDQAMWNPEQMRMQRDR
jgi:hypothetical protein